VLGTLAGMVTGCALATAIAVPTTWALTKDDQPTTDSVVETPTNGAADEADRFPQPEWGPDDAAGSSGSRASDEQSSGVVLIETVLGENDGAGAGTGMVLDEDGLVLTNYHVVEDSSSVKVTVATTGETYDAEVLGYDASADVALLDIDADDLTPVEIDDDGVEVGDDLTAVGNGGGQGYLSAVDGDVVAEDQSITASDMYGANGEELAGLIQTDAPAVSGYSGGPMVDDDGEVVGITTAAGSSGSTRPAAQSSQSYAVPIDDALAIADRIEDGDESGSVTVGPAAYLGVAVDDNLSVTEVQPSSAAAAAGLTAGDTLLEIDGEPTASVNDLQAAIADHEPDDSVSITWRDASGEQHEAEATLGQSPIN
jgi:S1-C subfamily serine protease